MATAYYKLFPSEIVKDILETDQPREVQIMGLTLMACPHVYPSNKFRTTNFLLESIKPLVKNATICDMGCGMGIVGLFALHNGAKSVVQADINPLAVKNAKLNRNLHGFSDRQLKIYESNCFDHIPLQKFDLIIFNVPFHTEPFEVKEPLEYAFHDPNFRSISTFLKQSKKYCHQNSFILIAFSNKGDTSGLEHIFNSLDFSWKIWKIANSDQKYDNRIYMLKLKNE